jgi:hypothetical protein
MMDDDDKVEFRLDLTAEEFDQLQCDAVMHGLTVDDFLSALMRQYRQNPWPLDPEA